MPERQSAQRQLPLHVGAQRGLSGRRRRWLCRLVLITVIALLLVYCLMGSKLPDMNPVNNDSSFPELELARQAKLQPPHSNWKNADGIPKIVHFVYGLRSPEPTLDIVNYLAIKSASDVIQPVQILFHYHYLPVGEYWERVKPLLTLRQIPLVTEVMGRPVTQYAHQADVVRLEALNQYGGIYLDMDLMMLKPIDHLLHNEFVMGQEGIAGSVGLCNAMIMARSGSPFLQRWYATYATFDQRDWNYHSVILPGKLAPHFTDEVTVLDHTAFFWPLWDTNGLRTLYLEKSYDFSANLGTHIWESASHHHLMAGLTEDVIMNIDNSLYCQLRRFLLGRLPDSRPNACRILARTERPDQLVGHWPMDRPNSLTNPARADDLSGNDLSGLVRDGTFTDGMGVHLTGRDSYVFLPMPVETKLETVTVSWWMKTSSEKEGGTAVSVQTSNLKIKALTQSILRDVPDTAPKNPTSLSLSAQSPFLDNDIPAGPFPINQDDEYHHYTLIINTMQPATPALSLFKDGYVTASSSKWQVSLPEQDTIRGIWFGSAEPEHSFYQDPWDNGPSLEASFANIKVWEKVLTSEDIRIEYAEGKPLFTPSQSADEKQSMTSDQSSVDASLLEATPTAIASTLQDSKGFIGVLEDENGGYADGSVEALDDDNDEEDDDEGDLLWGS